MKIKVIDEDKQRFCFALPTRLVLNRFTVLFVPLFLRKRKAEIGVVTCWKFVSGFYKVRKSFGGSFDLVDVEAKDGTLVKITV